MRKEGCIRYDQRKFRKQEHLKQESSVAESPKKKKNIPYEDGCKKRGGMWGGKKNIRHICGRN